MNLPNILNYTHTLHHSYKTKTKQKQNKTKKKTKKNNHTTQDNHTTPSQNPSQLTPIILGVCRVDTDLSIMIYNELQLSPKNVKSWAVHKSAKDLQGCSHCCHTCAMTARKMNTLYVHTGLFHCWQSWVDSTSKLDLIKSELHLMSRLNTKFSK